MTGNTGNPIEQVVQQIHKGHYSANKVPVRKVYIDEDPAKEQTEPCPRCLDRNQQHMMRYLFLNMNEAIYKCEAADCMYPFRNFKFKNFEECTVYRYQPQSQDGFDTALTNNFSNECYNYENSLDNVAAVDFSLDFLSSDSSNELRSYRTTVVEPASQLIAPPASDYANLSANFDTGFIDDILQDLFPSTPNPIPKTNNETNSKVIVSIQAASSSTENGTVELTCATVDSSTQSGGRKLEKCLRAFEKPSKPSEDDIFKVPKIPEANSLVVEHITPTKLRIKKIDSPTKNKRHKGSKHKRRNAPDSPNVEPSSEGEGGRIELKQASALVKNKKIKPLEFVSTLNTLMQQKKAELPAVEYRPTIRKTPNCAKVQKMLSFIQRSMKTSEGKESPPECRQLSESKECSRDCDNNLESSDPSNDTVVSSKIENYFVINGSMQPIDNEVEQA